MTVVEIDVLTGEVEVLRTDILYDAGKSLSPLVDLGQVEGAFIIGLGHFLTEALEYDAKTGALKTFDTWEYKPPCSTDIPIEWNVTLQANVPAPHGFLGSKATGEPPLLLANSVFFAVKRAIMASRKDEGTPKALGWFPLSAPATPPQIQQLCNSVAVAMTDA